MRGYNVMQGYYHLPEETAKTIDADGWLHTGDMGHLDATEFSVYHRAHKRNDHSRVERTFLRGKLSR